jgi:hypothetical protein
MVGNIFQYLDLKLYLKNGLHWENSSRGSKPISPYSSHLSGITKMATAHGLFWKSITCSCEHGTHSSINQQIDKLKKSGMPVDRIAATLRNVWHKVNRSGLKKVKKEWIKKRTAVIGFAHRISHSIRKTAKAFDSQISFKYTKKFKSLAGSFERYRLKRLETRKSCTHRKDISNIECEDGVVYKLPLKCGANYIGETGKCFNLRLQQHLEGSRKILEGTRKILENDANDIEETESQSNIMYSNINSHVKKCAGCCIMTQSCEIIKHKVFDVTTRRLVEGYHIVRDENNISKCILEPTQNESAFLEHYNLIK